MVSSHRWYWAPWKFQWEDVILQNPCWRTVGAKQLHFYYNPDFVAGEKYSFIAYGWALCSGEPSLSGTSNHLVAQPVIIEILVLCTNLLNKDFTSSQWNSAGQMQIHVWGNLFLPEVTSFIRNDPFNAKFLIYLFYICQCSQICHRLTS